VFSPDASITFFFQKPQNSKVKEKNKFKNQKKEALSSKIFIKSKKNLYSLPVKISYHPF